MRPSRDAFDGGRSVLQPFSQRGGMAKAGVVDEYIHAAEACPGRSERPAYAEGGGYLGGLCFIG